MNNCRQKYILLILLMLIFGSSQSQGQAGPASSPQNAMINNAGSNSANTREKELLEKREKAVELQLKNLELDRELIQGQYGNLDFSQKLLAAFLAFISIFFIVAGIFGFKNIRDIKKEVEKELTEKTQKTIKATMVSVSEKPILDLTETVNRIDNQLKDLKDAYEKHAQEKLPTYGKPDTTESENVFDQNENS